MEVATKVRKEGSLAAVAQAANSRLLLAFLPSSNRQIGEIGVLALLRGMTPTIDRRIRARSLSNEQSDLPYRHEPESCNLENVV